MTSREIPGDFDACWEIEGVNFSYLAMHAPMLLDIRPPRAAQRVASGGERLPARVSADALGTAYLDFFQRDRDTGQRKGIVALSLEGLP